MDLASSLEKIHFTVFVKLTQEDPSSFFHKMFSVIHTLESEDSHAPFLEKGKKKTKGEQYDE